VRLEAFTVSAIRTALELQQEMGFSMVLVGATQAHRLAEELAAADVPVILSVGRMGNPDFPSETLLSRWSTLKEAGVKVALARGRSGADLLLAGGQLISAGANQTDVWHALTTIPAQILGIDQKFGSIGNGQSGSMILFEGSSPFDLSAPFRAHKPR
jgi:imidazolonepropionase-like amidohydrolase